MLASSMKVVQKKLSELIPYARNPRKNDDAINSVAASIKEFGFKQPLVLDKDDVIIVGHTRAKAALKLGLETVPCIIATDLSAAQIKAYRVLDNKIAEKAEWNEELLALELEEIEIDLEPFEVAFGHSEQESPETIEGWKEFDESAADDVQFTQCPSCGHKFPK